NIEYRFGCKITINFKGLKYLVLNYPFVFEVSEKENVGGVLGYIDEVHSNSIEILPPRPNAPEIAVVDSGIMEGNKYISPAIKPGKSSSYIKDDSSVADQVSNGGHGTKVAGAILYPKGVSHIKESYELP